MSAPGIALPPPGSAPAPTLPKSSDTFDVTARIRDGAARWGTRLPRGPDAEVFELRGGQREFRTNPQPLPPLLGACPGAQVTGAGAGPGPGSGPGSGRGSGLGAGGGGSGSSGGGPGGTGSGPPGAGTGPGKGPGAGPGPGTGVGLGGTGSFGGVPTINAPRDLDGHVPEVRLPGLREATPPAAHGVDRQT
nr:hypothetical protein KitaXyl93_01040 [Kitasatospora sp. Xyl93]